MTSDHVKIPFNAACDTIFRPHGEYSAQLEGQLIRSEVTGPLNLEMIKAYGTAVAPLWSKAASQGRFCVLTVMHGSMLMAPDAFEHFMQVTKTLTERVPQFAGIAQVVAPEVEGRSVMSALYQNKVYAPLNLPYEIFDNLASAQTWLTEVVLGHPVGRS